MKKRLKVNSYKVNKILINTNNTLQQTSTFFPI